MDLWKFGYFKLPKGSLGTLKCLFNDTKLPFGSLKYPKFRGSWGGGEGGIILKYTKVPFGSLKYPKFRASWGVWIILKYTKVPFGSLKYPKFRAF